MEIIDTRLWITTSDGVLFIYKALPGKRHRYIYRYMDLHDEWWWEPTTVVVGGQNDWTFFIGSDHVSEVVITDDDTLEVSRHTHHSSGDVIASAYDIQTDTLFFVTASANNDFLAFKLESGRLIRRTMQADDKASITAVSAQGHIAFLRESGAFSIVQPFENKNTHSVYMGDPHQIHTGYFAEFIVTDEGKTYFVYLGGRDSEITVARCTRGTWQMRTLLVADTDVGYSDFSAFLDPGTDGQNLIVRVGPDRRPCFRREENDLAMPSM
ncbi:hypothetical protein DM02DRAFT_663566 [Periconia macrospinosa]|uniref:Uncharacterized protein n=1 Tax=Periconia macrospinosa TaxID=97972 RepID=A0A2V1D1D3_9PLEO|nr:hypothetical protein DM02DRAFT_663566 [Periconia macrospinosa]